MIRRFGEDEDIERLFPVIETWLSECHANEFGINIEVTSYLNTAYNLIEHEDGDLMVMEYKGEIIGLMGITLSKSPIGDQKIANVLYWYTLPEHRGKGISFVVEAIKWAKKKSCSHIIYSASKMGSDLHDRVCMIYERMNMKKFDTSYILELGTDK